MRRIVVTLAWVLATTLVVGGIAGALVYSSADTTTAGKLRFERPLRIPPLLEGRADGAGRRIFDLRLRAGRGGTWGVNGTHLGPTLRAARGDRVVMRVRSALPEPTTLHWHGMELPARADGGPHQPIAPGRVWAPSWTIEQLAGTLWYHAHPHGNTEDQVYRGLAGMWIVDDPAASRLALPRTYGVDDIPLILQDKRIGEDGALEFSESPISPAGRLGDDVLVNGTADPHVVVEDSLVRFRLLNASTARTYAIGFADGRRFDLIATDGGLVERPVGLTRVQLSPGERAEIVARFQPGERVVLRSFPPDLETDFFHERFSGGDDTLDLLQVRASEQLRPSAALPARLTAPTALPDGGRIRRFELSGSRRINGQTMAIGRVDAVVEAGATEIWEVSSRGNTPHNFHVHGVQFRVVEYAGGRVPAALSGPKDTVYVPPGETVRLAIRFGGFRDPGTPYVFHCHLLKHEDSGMMGQYVAR